MTVQDFINELQELKSPDSQIAATWEGIIRSVEIYKAGDGTILIDADGGFYKERFQKDTRPIQVNL